MGSNRGHLRLDVNTFGGVQYHNSPQVRRGLNSAPFSEGYGMCMNEDDQRVGKARYLEVSAKFRGQGTQEQPVDKGTLNTKQYFDWAAHQTLILVISVELCRARKYLTPLPLLEHSEIRSMPSSPRRARSRALRRAEQNSEHWALYMLHRRILNQCHSQWRMEQRSYESISLNSRIMSSNESTVSRLILVQ